MINRRQFMAGAAAAGLAGLEGCASAPQAEPGEKVDVWNLHCHLYGLPGTTGEEKVGNTLKIADRLGINRLIFYMGMEVGSRNPTTQDIRRYNDECMAAIKPWHPRVLGFVYLNPDHPEFCLEELDRCVKNGPLVGVKLWVARRCNARELDAVVRRATELGAPIYQHTWMNIKGNQPGESTPYDIVELAARHPDAKLICGHSGGDWERGIRIIRSTSSLTLELAGFDPAAGVAEMALRELGPERLIYGSDTGGRSFASQIAKVRGADIPASAKRLALGGNLRRLLKPILDQKGYPA
ncbi:MAG TPA: amidohydrolase family protein [Planctomycetota bacterium]|nr:amidohydrolase family protein [Planctomycetota bacterium]